MSIISPEFFAFGALLIPVYFFCTPKKFQWVVLLVASYIFYAFAGLEVFVFILFTTFIVHISALWLSKIHQVSSKSEDEKESGHVPWYFKISKKWVVGFVLVCNFGVLAYFKWYNTIAHGINNLIDESTGFLPMNHLLLPLGISFYTFQATGYLIDVYRKQIKPERNFGRFALFVSYFPQLIQGPISRHSQLAEQLYASRKFDYVEARRGFQLVLWGLIKKMVIADRLVIVTRTIFSNTIKYSGLYLLYGIILSMVRVYTDFSGGVDIVRGSSQMLGINMPENFRRPFFATSLPEYWRRWHMSLNNWWRDYLFYPFVLSKYMARINGFVRKYISTGLAKVLGVYIGINIVRVINAMWHGAQPYFIANGFYYGILMVLGLVLAPTFQKTIKGLHINTDCFSWRLFQILRTFLLVCLSRTFIATGSVKAGFSAFGSIIKDFNPWIFSDFNFLLSLGFTELDRVIFYVSLILLLVVEIIQERGVQIRETLEKQNIVFQWIVILAGIFIVILWGTYGEQYDAVSFVYQLI